MENFSYLDNFLLNDTHFHFTNPLFTDNLPNNHHAVDNHIVEHGALDTTYPPTITEYNIINETSIKPSEDLMGQSRLGAVNDRRNVDNALLVLGEALYTWGTGTLARSTMTTIGSVLVSVLVGLLLWLGILQYLGIPRQPSRRESYQEEYDILEAIAEKVVKDLALYTRNKRIDNIPASLEEQLIPYPITIQEMPLGDPNLIRRIDDDKYILSNHFSSPGNIFESITKRKLPLKPFKPSPIDDVIEAYTANPAYNRRIFKRRPSKSNFKFRKVKARKRAPKRTVLHRKSKFIRREDTGVPKAISDHGRSLLFPRIAYELSKKYHSEKKPEKKSTPNDEDFHKLQLFQNLMSYYTENSKNIFSSNIHKRSRNLRDKHIEKRLPDQYKYINKRNSLSRGTIKHATDIPFHVTTFRSNRRNNFMDSIGNDPYQIEQYFPNHYQPINLYGENGYHRGQSTEMKEQYPGLTKQIRNFSNDLISEYVDPTTHETNNIPQKIELPTKFNKFDNIPKFNNSRDDMFHSFNHRYGGIIDESSTRNKIKFPESPATSTTKYLKNIVNTTENSLDQALNLKDLTRQIAVVSNNTLNRHTFERVKGISDELLMALFPNYMHEQSVDKTKHHQYTD